MTARVILVAVVLGSSGCGSEVGEPRCESDGEAAVCEGGIVVCELEEDPAGPWCDFMGLIAIENTGGSAALPICADGSPVCPEGRVLRCVACPGVPAAALPACDPASDIRGAYDVCR